MQYQTYDITELLSARINAVGAIFGNGWYKGNLAWVDSKYIFGDQTALLLQLLIKYEDGTEEIVTSDEQWKASESPILLSEIYHGEIFDARLEKTNWSTPAIMTATGTTWRYYSIQRILLKWQLGKITVKF